MTVKVCDVVNLPHNEWAKNNFPQQITPQKRFQRIKLFKVWFCTKSLEHFERQGILQSLSTPQA